MPPSVCLSENRGVLYFSKATPCGTAFSEPSLQKTYQSRKRNKKILKKVKHGNFYSPCFLRRKTRYSETVRVSRTIDAMPDATPDNRSFHHKTAFCTLNTS